MKRSLLCQLFGMAVLSGTFLAGCSHGVHSPTCSATTAEPPRCRNCRTCDPNSGKGNVSAYRGCTTVVTTCRSGDCQTVVISPGRYKPASTWARPGRLVPVAQAPAAAASPYAYRQGSAVPGSLCACTSASAAPAATSSGGLPPTVEIRNPSTQSELPTSAPAPPYYIVPAEGFRPGGGDYLPDVPGSPSAGASPVNLKDGWVVFDKPQRSLVFPHHLHDITTHPAFAHARDHRWLVGRLETGETPNSWTLRYASVDDDDDFGGRVTLVLTQPLSGYHEGQLVRVEGQVANPSDHEWGAAYQVQAIAPLSNAGTSLHEQQGGKGSKDEYAQ